MRRIRALVDVDGVLADFLGEVLYRLPPKSTGKRVSKEEVTTWEIFDSPAFAEFAHLRRDVYDSIKREGGCYNIAPLPGAREGFAALREVADVTIVTSPFSGSKTWVHERLLWLRDFFEVEEKDVIFAHDKRMIRGDMLIDDKPANVYSWFGDEMQARTAVDPYAIACLWDHPFNRANADAVSEYPIVRVTDWEQVLDLAKILSQHDA